MRKNGNLSFVLLGMLILLFGGPALGDGAGEKMTGYFPDRVYVRPRMEKTLESVGSIGGYCIVTIEKVDENWAAYTTPEGAEGYVRYASFLPVPGYEPEPAWDVYPVNRTEVRSLPNYNAERIYTAAAEELLTVDGRSGGFLHVTARDGSEGYVMKSWVKKAEFRPKKIRTVTFCVGEDVPLLDYPLQGARETGTLRRDTLYHAQRAYGNYYAVEADGIIRYVAKQRVGLCVCKGGEERIFFQLPKVKGEKRTENQELIFAPAVISATGGTLWQPTGETAALPSGTLVYVYAAYGGWYGVTIGADSGYLPREDAELLTGERMTAWIREKDLSGGSVRRNELLDAAFTMVEEGNPFQIRYNLLTGADVRSLFPLGVPYFWGGRNYQAVCERLPLYTTREAWQSSRAFYLKGTTYIYGFDCVGFVKNVYALTGRKIAGTLAERGDQAYCAAGAHIFCDDAHPLPEDWTEAARQMRVGDIMLIHHPGLHVMIYMGTLREFGYTADQLPALAGYLDYPLMLHCGQNHYSYQRFQSLIEAAADPKLEEVSPTDGGVGVCILGVDKEDAEMAITCHEAVSRCFDVEGSCVTIMGFANVRDYFVYRPGTAGEPEAVDTGEASEDDEPE